MPEASAAFRFPPIATTPRPNTVKCRTTLNLISGLESPSSGRILFGTDDVTILPPEERGVGLVFQNYALYPHLTVEENIIFPLQNLKGRQKMTNEAMHEKAVSTAKLVQIDHLMER